MTTPAHQRERQRLARALKALRAGAFPSGAQLAARLGWAQSKVSRIETGQQQPSEDDIATWVTAAGGSAETAAELAAMLRAARTGYVAWRDEFPGAGAAAAQEDILRYEAQSVRIAEFQPGIVSGLVQTAGYAREMLHLPCGPLSFGTDEGELERMIGVRLRRQRALSEGAHQVTVIMLEAALTARVASVATLQGQLAWLMSASGLPSLELGIVPREAPLPIFPLGGWRLYDKMVVVEDIAGEKYLEDADSVARYEKYLELLRGVAATGPEAEAVIQRALDDLRESP